MIRGWRPEGWKNTFAEIGSFTFEAGADAMYETLQPKIVELETQIRWLEVTRHTLIKKITATPERNCSTCTYLVTKNNASACLLAGGGWLDHSLCGFATNFVCVDYAEKEEAWNE